MPAADLAFHGLPVRAVFAERHQWGGPAANGRLRLRAIRDLDSNGRRAGKGGATMLPLTLHASTTTVGALVKVGGALDFETAQDFHDLLPSLELRPGQRLDLDLGAVEFFDSSGIRALLAARNLAAATGAGLTLMAVPDHVWRVLDAVGLTDRFAPDPTPPQVG